MNVSGEAEITLEAEPLPENIKVIGTPRISGVHHGRMNPIIGSFNYNDIYSMQPRLVFGNQAYGIDSLEKTAQISDLGWSGKFSFGGNYYPYKVGITPKGELDGFPFKLQFTTPIILPSFSYEYIIAPIDFDGFQLSDIQENFHASFNNYQFRNTPKTYLSDQTVSGLILLKGTTPVAGMSFNDLRGKANNTYYQVKNANGVRCLILGFEFSGLSAGQTFNNDGYFGSTSTSYSYPIPENYIVGGRLQNTVGDGNVTKIETYVQGSAGGNIRQGMYTSTATPTATTLLVDAGAATMANGWTTKTCSATSVTNGTYYYLAYLLDTEKGIYYDSASSTNIYFERAYSYGALPNPATPDTYYPDTIYSMRAYVELGGYTPQNYTYISLSKIGIKESARRKITRTRTGLAKIGIKSLATRKKTIKRIAPVKLGVLVKATRKIAVKRIGLVLVGIKSLADRFLTLTRIAPVLIGIKAIASVTITHVGGNVYEFISLVAIGVKSNATKFVALTKISSVKIGVKLLATRSTTITRSNLVKLGIKALASRKKAIKRIGVARVGVKVLASRTFTITRISKVKIGVKALATRVKKINRIAPVKIGVKLIASRKTTIRRIGLSLIGIKALATRKVSIRRIALTKIGIKVSASVTTAISVIVHAFARLVLKLFGRSLSPDILDTSLSLKLNERNLTSTINDTNLTVKENDRNITLKLE